MPALPPVPNVCKVAISGLVDGEPWAGVSHWHFVPTSGSMTNANATQIAGDVGNRWGAYIAGHTSNTVTLEEVVVTDLTSSTAAVGTAAPALVGGHVASLVSPAICALEHKSIARRYRGGHPRTYWPGVAVVDTVSSNGRTFDATTLATWQTDIDDYYNGVESFVTADPATNMASFVEVCVHYRSGNLPLAVPTWDGINSRQIEANLASQRRRLHRSS